MSSQSYQLKINLFEIEPMVWRELLTPADITLDRLHDVIQIVMGWMDYHEHEFTFKTKTYSEQPELGTEARPEDKVPLSRLLKKKGDALCYRYDFGDSWDHEITLEQVMEMPEPKISFLKEPSLKCLSGARACPPEDIGGGQGYAEFCAAICDPNHSEYKHLKAWYAELYPTGREFNPEEFNVDWVNLQLLRYMRWSRPRQVRYDFWG